MTGANARPILPLLQPLGFGTTWRTVCTPALLAGLKTGHSQLPPFDPNPCPFDPKCRFRVPENRALAAFLPFDPGSKGRMGPGKSGLPNTGNLTLQKTQETKNMHFWAITPQIFHEQKVGLGEAGVCSQGLRAFKNARARRGNSLASFPGGQRPPLSISIRLGSKGGRNFSRRDFTPWNSGV